MLPRIGSSSLSRVLQYAKDRLWKIEEKWSGTEGNIEMFAQ